MAQDLREQLQSDDPKVRAEAIKQIALSGNQDFLQDLKDIVENDQDPRLREYAKKAARHLYGSGTSPAPAAAPPTSAPPTTVSQEIREQASQIEPAKNNAHPISRKKREAADGKVQRALTLHMAGQTDKAKKQLIQALDLNPYLKDETFVKGVAAELTGRPSGLAVQALTDPTATSPEVDPTQELASVSDYMVDPGSADEDDDGVVPERTNLMGAWLSFLSMTEDFFKAEARKANGEDTLLSVLVYTISAVVIFMINGFFQFQQISTIMNEQLPAMGSELPAFDFNIGIIFFVILIGTVIMTPISFYLSVGLQFLGSRIFGGVGTFKTHAYLMGLVIVPMTILSGAVGFLSLIPMGVVIGGIAGFGLSIYSIILTVRLVKAAHKLGTGRAVAAIIVPPIALSLLFGCLIMTVGGSLIGSLMQMQ